MPVIDSFDLFEALIHLLGFLVAIVCLKMYSQMLWMGILCFSAMYSFRPCNAVGILLIFMGFFQWSV